MFTLPPTLRPRIRALATALVPVVTRVVSVGRVQVVALASLTMLSAPVAAQSDLTLEFGGSQVGPPLGAEGDNARFVVGGLRAAHYGANGSGLFGSALFGQTLDSAVGGSFLSGVAGATLVDRWTPTLSGSLDAKFLGYGTQMPFPYRAFAAEGRAALRYRQSHFGVDLTGLGGVGRSQLQLSRPGGTRVFLVENDLWRVGGTAEVTVGPVTSSFGVVGGLHDTPEGLYRSVGGRLTLAGFWGLAELRVDAWKTPEATRTIAGLALIIPLGNDWSARGFFGRTDPDPLTLAQPGSGSGGVLLGRTILGGVGGASSASGPWEVIAYGESSSRVRLSVDADVNARVQLLGDFTLWEPVDMMREDGRWYAEIDVPAGTHHFGFLIDDEWFVPDDATDVVPDEWGRMSAILVIEGASK